MLLDANLLLDAVDARSPYHRPVAHWLGGVLNGDVGVGFAWRRLRSSTVSS